MEITFALSLPAYLRQWIVAEMGGQEPLHFPKGSAYTSFLRVFIRHKRESEFSRPMPDDLRIVVPRFPGKDPQYHNYLPERARKALVQLIRDHFDAAILADLVSFENIGRKKNEILLAWMEEHGIEITDRNTCAVLKRVQIIRNRLSDRKRKRDSYRAKS